MSKDSEDEVIYKINTIKPPDDYSVKQIERAVMLAMILDQAFPAVGKLPGRGAFLLVEEPI